MFAKIQTLRLFKQKRHELLRASFTQINLIYLSLFRDSSLTFTLSFDDNSFETVV